MIYVLELTLYIIIQAVLDPYQKVLVIYATPIL